MKKELTAEQIKKSRVYWIFAFMFLLVLSLGATTFYEIKIENLKGDISGGICEDLEGIISHSCSLGCTYLAQDGYLEYESYLGYEDYLNDCLEKCDSKAEEVNREICIE